MKQQLRSYQGVTCTNHTEYYRRENWVCSVCKGTRKSVTPLFKMFSKLIQNEGHLPEHDAKLGDRLTLI